jgi:hypothetical protein
MPQPRAPHTAAPGRESRAAAAWAGICIGDGKRRTKADTKKSRCPSIVLGAFLRMLVCPWVQPPGRRPESGACVFLCRSVRAPRLLAVIWARAGARQEATVRALPRSGRPTGLGCLAVFLLASHNRYALCTKHGIATACSSEASGARATTARATILSSYQILPLVALPRLAYHHLHSLSGFLNQTTQPWYTGSTHKRVVSVHPGHRVYEARVD